MDTKVALRLQLLRLIRIFGMSQKVIAGWMNDMDASTLSKWVREEIDRAPNSDEMDGLDRFLSALKEEVTRDVTQVTREEHARLMTAHEASEIEHHVKAEARHPTKRRAPRKPARKGSRLAQR